MLHKINSLLTKLFIADKWNIGYLVQTTDELITNKKLNQPITWMKEDNIDYAADPFIVEFEGRTRIYYEELDFWRGKGDLMMIDNFDFRTKRKVTGIEPKSIHLSYPYLIALGKNLYCIPETSANNEVVLYKVDPKKPEHLIRLSTIIKGKAFVDSSIIYYQNKFWLFTSVSGEMNLLYVFYANEITGKFEPHKLNPIRVEKDACRGAGNLFQLRDKLYRPTQNPLKRYGGSIVVSEIKVLNEYEYETITDFEISPDKRYNLGLHNISFTQNMIVIDGKRKSFSLLMPLKKLAKKIRTKVSQR